MKEIEEIAKLLSIGKKGDGVSLSWGKVISVDSKSVNVNMAGQQVSTVRCCDCAAGDVVLLISQRGTVAAIAKRRR